MEEVYILSLDIGTSTIRSVIYNSRTEIVGNAFNQVVLHYPKTGFVEIDPEELWVSINEAVKKSLQDASLSAGQIAAMGISTQRSTFITWSRKTGQPFHRFCTWKDIRADKLVKEWNNSYTWKFIKVGAYILHMVSRSKRFKAGSVFKFSNNQYKPVFILDASLSAGQIAAMGISTQRSTFITWSRKTGQPFHRFCTWKDIRADKLVKEWNNSYTWKFIKVGAYILHMVSRSKRFKAGSVFKFSNNQTTLRLVWALNNVQSLKSAVQSGDAMFGTLDTWLLYKLTGNFRHKSKIGRWFMLPGNKLHMSDVSSASATGFFDPFTMQWAGWAMTIFGIPMSALPEVVDTAGDHFTSTDPEIFGCAIPIRCCIADQTASMWGSCCFDVGEVKLTMGTGTFFNINTGRTPHASVSGLYPVVGWRLGNELVFSAEGANNDTATVIKWAQRINLFENPADTADIAMSVSDTDGVYFIPAFSGLGPPYNDCTAGTGLVGIKPSTSKAHLVRAVLEAIAFRTVQLFHCIRSETSYTFHSIRLDGGVSNNDFIAQLVSDLTGLRVERPQQVEKSSLGCAHIVGLHLGIFKSKDDIMSLRKIGKVFTPRAHVKKNYEYTFSRWEDAVKRMCGWYTEPRDTQAVSDTNGVSRQNNKMAATQNGGHDK
ncbi:Putative glycerol kinase 5 [Papilio machaon]|uniref:Glycerol kinase 5 n=1 Tax=Papilio machaon TaxID=76193 RepID=A0A194QXK1_PAPMA|nr:Putative glycerol kinase 5 [Papilio machaon]